MRRAARRYMADMVIGYLQNMLAAAALFPPAGADEAAASAALPEPMLPGNHESLGVACLHDAALRDAATKGEAGVRPPACGRSLWPARVRLSATLQCSDMPGSAGAAGYMLAVAGSHILRNPALLRARASRRMTRPRTAVSADAGPAPAAAATRPEPPACARRRASSGWTTSRTTARTAGAGPAPSRATCSRSRCPALRPLVARSQGTLQHPAACARGARASAVRRACAAARARSAGAAVQRGFPRCCAPHDQEAAHSRGRGIFRVA